MFQEKVFLETPEHVPVEFEPAGPMSRYAAGMYDGLILFIGLFLLGILFALGAWAVGDAVGRDVYLAVGIGLGGLVLMGYFPLFEYFWHGQTPGKRELGIRVMRRDMAPLDFGSVVVRGALRIVDFLPGLPMPLLGIVTMTLTDQALRIGDLAAGTWVVRDPDAEAIPVRAPRKVAAAAAGVPGEGRLTAEEFALAREFLGRAGTLDPQLRRAAAMKVAAPILRRLGESRLDAERFLAEEVGKGAAGRSLV